MKNSILLSSVTGSIFILKKMEYNWHLIPKSPNSKVCWPPGTNRAKILKGLRDHLGIRPVNFK